MQKTNQRIIQLDGLPFFAVVMVMLAHWMQWQWTNSVLKVFPFTQGVVKLFFKFLVFDCYQTR